MTRTLFLICITACAVDAPALSGTSSEATCLNCGGDGGGGDAPDITIEGICSAYCGATSGYCYDACLQGLTPRELLCQTFARDFCVRADGTTDGACYAQVYPACVNL